MKIAHKVYFDILRLFPPVPPEEGGIIGWKNGMICRFLKDRSEQSCDAAAYSPDVGWINQCIKYWEAEGIQFAGIIHSHLGDQPTLSDADITYIRKIMQANSGTINTLYFPIVLPQREIIPYKACIHNGIVEISEDILSII